MRLDQSPRRQIQSQFFGRRAELNPAVRAAAVLMSIVGGKLDVERRADPAFLVKVVGVASRRAQPHRPGTRKANARRLTTKERMLPVIRQRRYVLAAMVLAQASRRCGSPAHVCRITHPQSECRRASSGRRARAARCGARRVSPCSCADAPGLRARGDYWLITRPVVR